MAFASDRATGPNSDGNQEIYLASKPAGAAWGGSILLGRGATASLTTTFTGKAVASGHADIYASLAGAMASLYGPLHGRANQECLEFALAHGVDAVSQSFVANAGDVQAVRSAAEDAIRALEGYWE